MTPRDFAIWMRGFITACNEYQPTPKQWEKIKEVLQSVEELKNISYPLDILNLPDNTTTTAGSYTTEKVLLKD